MFEEIQHKFEIAVAQVESAGTTQLHLLKQNLQSRMATEDPKKRQNVEKKVDKAIQKHLKDMQKAMQTCRKALKKNKGGAQEMKATLEQILQQMQKEITTVLDACCIELNETVSIFENADIGNCIGEFVESAKDSTFQEINKIHGNLDNFFEKRLHVSMVQ